MRALPLSGLLDSVCFLLHCHNNGFISSIVARLDENNPNLVDQIPTLSIDATQYNRLKHLGRFLDFFFDFKARVFPAVFIIFAYAKLCMLGGVPVSRVIGSVYFFSWFILEAVLLSQRFRRRRLWLPELQEALAPPQREEYTISLRNLRFFNRILIAIQISTVLIVTIDGVVRLVRRGGQPGSILSTSILSTSNFSALLAWLFIPTRWAVNWGMTFMDFMEDKVPYNFLLAAFYGWFVLLPCLPFVFIFVEIIFFFNLFIIVTPILFLSFPIMVLGNVHAFRFLIARKIFVARNLRVVSFLLLGGSVLYYIGIYNPAGTSKQAGSDVLG
jgi:hypothetical protein